VLFRLVLSRGKMQGASGDADYGDDEDVLKSNRGTNLIMLRIKGTAP
jgi:hypothetical protein